VLSIQICKIVLDFFGKVYYSIKGILGISASRKWFCRGHPEKTTDKTGKIKANRFAIGWETVKPVAATVKMLPDPNR
jgi:hypothetical protein